MFLFPIALVRASLKLLAIGRPISLDIMCSKSQSTKFCSSTCGGYDWFPKPSSVWVPIVDESNDQIVDVLVQIECDYLTIFCNKSHQSTFHNTMGNVGLMTI